MMGIRPKWPLVFILIFVFVPKYLHSQLHGKERIDSLILRLNKIQKVDKRIEILADISFGLYSSNPRLGREYSHH